MLDDDENDQNQEEDEAPPLISLPPSSAPSVLAPASFLGSPEHPNKSQQWMQQHSDDTVNVSSSSIDSVSISAPVVPLTILTGFLGAGKSTLIARLFRHFIASQRQILVLNNETAAFSSPLPVPSSAQRSTSVSASASASASIPTEGAVALSTSSSLTAVQRDSISSAPPVGSLDSTSVHNTADKAKSVLIRSLQTSLEPSLLTSIEERTYGTVLELRNGCICCTVNNDFITALNNLTEQHTFAYILVECSGLANPGPLIHQFWVDSELQHAVYLDGVVGLVDGFHFLHHLQGDECTQVLHQIAYSDRVILNKMDLCSKQQITAIKKNLQSIDSSLPILTTSYCQVDWKQILYLNAFDHPRELKKALTQRMLQENHDQMTKQHSEHFNHSSNVTAFDVEQCVVTNSSRFCPLREKGLFDPHDMTISSLLLQSASGSFVNELRLRNWLSILLWQDVYDKTNDEKQAGDSSHPMHIFRMKGRLIVADESVAAHSRGVVRYLQAVQSVYEIFDGPEDYIQSQASCTTSDVVLQRQHKYDSNQDMVTRVVVIGRGLKHTLLEQGFATIFN